MSQEQSSEVARKLELLKHRFREKATSELEQLEAIVTGFRRSGVTVNGLVALYHSLHRLAGSAGTFGYPVLGEEARGLERQLKPWAAGLRAESPEAGLYEECSGLVDQPFVSRVAGLRRLLDGAQGAHCPAGSGQSPSAPANADGTLLLIVDPDSERAENLAKDLQLHGFLIATQPSLDGIQEVSGISALLIRDASLPADLRRFPAIAGAPPVISIGAKDSFSERYRYAELGAEGFWSNSSDVPALADYLERLITEHQESGTGRVMIVDDDPELLEHYGLVLEEGGFEVRRVNDPSTILSALSEFRPDLVLMDIQMGSFYGPELARMLRFDPEWLGLSIVYLSSEEDRQFQVEALSKGGDDFLIKPMSDQLLLRAVSVRCYRARQLDKLASRDSLTGLLKHAVAKQEIQKEHQRSTRLGQPAVVAMLDLDHFKQVNDRYGHRTGDLVIKGTANLLRYRLRKTDVIGRYGGEEFVAVLPDCTVSDAGDVFQSICDQLSRIVFTASGEEFSVTLSIGMAALDGFSSSEAALEAADQALYRCKLDGRNGVVTYNQNSQRREAAG